MAADFNMFFFVIFVILLAALAIANMVAAQSTQYRKPGQMYFGLLYMVGAIILIVYKINNP
jgi:hypothetical protein